jgi:hypothetical protein
LSYNLRLLYITTLRAALLLVSMDAEIKMDGKTKNNAAPAKALFASGEKLNTIIDKVSMINDQISLAMNPSAFLKALKCSLKKYNPINNIKLNIKTLS